MRYIILLVSILFLLLSIDSMLGVYLIAKGFIMVHIEQPFYFFMKLLLYFLMGILFFCMSFYYFKKYRRYKIQ
ncbi:hypothetical protein BA086_25300 [Salmonella enterica]|uniref:Uncharacterized protein n=1 Tax=Salmonella enterica TaxID=28901 RepID=A0A402XLJ5_SALER|nr:hypothetical protein [Salmonella enterica]MIV66243.1 hypothetical protein [Salmonella enterica]